MLSRGTAWGALMPEISEKDWVRSEPCFLARMWQHVERFVRRSLPGVFSAELTVGGIFLFLAQAAVLAGIALTPVAFAAAFPAKEGETGIPASAWWQSLLLLGLQVAKFSLEKIKTKGADHRHKMQHLSDMSVSLTKAIGHIARSIRSNPRSSQDTEHLLHHALTCISSIVKLCTNNNDDRYFCATLLTFEGDGSVQVRARSASHRPTGKTVPQEETIAYWVSKYGAENKVVHDFPAECRKHNFRMLNYKSLSTPTPPPYVSILLLPLPTVRLEGLGEVRKGVVTIDAGKCYEFLGSETAIQVRVGGYLELINVLLMGHNTGVQPEVSHD